MDTDVMIIDPSSTSRLILRTALRRAGIESVAYEDGHQVFCALRADPGLAPRVGLLEADLPGIDGYSLARLLKTHTRLAHCTFIMLSRRVGVLDRILGRLAGAAASLPKPFDTRQVVATVQHALAAAQRSRKARTDDRMPEQELVRRWRAPARKDGRFP